MKRLKWQFKKSRSISSAVTCALIVMVACTASMKDDFFSHSNGIKAPSEQEYVNPLVAKSEPESIRAYPSANELLGLKLEKSFCNMVVAGLSPSMVLPVYLSLDHAPDLVIVGRSAKSDLVSVKIDGDEYFLSTPFEILERAQASACRNDFSQEKNTDLAALLSDIREQFAPSCAFEPLDSKGWLCKLKIQDPSFVIRDLKQLQKSSLKNLKRQPYSYLRRLAVVRQLAKTLVSGKGPDSFVRFCNLLDISHPKELPFSMTSKRWRKLLCENSGSEQEYWGGVALSQAQAELHFLEAILSDSNRVGQLKIQIPRDVHETREFLVRLRPQNDVFASLNTNFERLNPSFFSIAGPSLKPEVKESVVRTSCWDPFFHEDGENARKLSSLMNLHKIKSSSRDCYRDSKSSIESSEHVSYVYESIVGETSFAVGNGRYKILYLPSGTYSYTAKNLPASAKRWSPSAVEEKSEGSIAWTKNRPRPIIRTWQQ